MPLSTTALSSALTLTLASARAGSFFRLSSISIATLAVEDSCAGGSWISWHARLLVFRKCWGRGVGWFGRRLALLRKCCSNTRQDAKDEQVFHKTSLCLTNFWMRETAHIPPFGFRDGLGVIPLFTVPIIHPVARYAVTTLIIRLPKILTMEYPRRGT